MHHSTERDGDPEFRSGAFRSPSTGQCAVHGAAGNRLSPVRVPCLDGRKRRVPRCARWSSGRNRPGSKVEAREETDLIAGARGGDIESFEDLVAPYEARVYRVLSRMLGNEADAQDALQETLLKAFEKVSTFRGESAFGTWLHRIAVNQALMALRKKGADPMRVVDDPLTFDWMDAHARRIEDWSPSAEGGALRDEARNVLSRALSGLPEIDRAVVLLKDAEGFSHEEIAEVTGLSVVAARSRLHRARLVLRERLSDYFGERAGGSAGSRRRGIARLFGR